MLPGLAWTLQTGNPNPRPSLQVPLSPSPSVNRERDARAPPCLALPCLAPASSLLAHIGRKQQAHLSARARPRTSQSRRTAIRIRDAEVRRSSSRRQGPAQDKRPAAGRPGGHDARPRSRSRNGGPRPWPRSADADGRTRQGRQRSATPDEGRPRTRTRTRAGPGDAAAASQ